VSVLEAPDAACREVPTRFFFPEVADDPRSAAYVAMFCDLCPVRSECLEWALTNHERYGIWGGKTETERRAILRQRHGPSPHMARRRAS